MKKRALRLWVWTTLVGLTLLTLGCAFAGPPVVVSGTERDLTRLEGDWWGDYASDADHRRQGTISFKLLPNGRQAHGSVLMKADKLPYPYQPFGGDVNARQRPDSAPETRLLSIRFIYVSDGEVAGELDPYWDPDRGARAVTTFLGSIDGPIITGTFRTRYANGVAQTGGRWKVTRRP